MDYALQHESEIDWDWVSQYCDLSDDDIRKAYDKLNWWLVVQCQIPLNESLIREMADYVAWNYVGCKQKLSNDFIREFNVRIW